MNRLARDEGQLLVDLQAGFELLGFQIEIGEVGLNEGLVGERGAAESIARLEIGALEVRGVLGSAASSA